MRRRFDSPSASSPSPSPSVAAVARGRRARGADRHRPGRRPDRPSIRTCTRRTSPSPWCTTSSITSCAAPSRTASSPTSPDWPPPGRRSIPTTWEFKLRRGVKFHNGEDLNAEAVKFSIERVLNPDQKARWRWAFADIERVEVVDPLTLRIVTKRPFPTLITNLAYAMPIVPPKYVREKGDAYVGHSPGRLGAVQVRPLAQGRRAGARGQ